MNSQGTTKSNPLPLGSTAILDEWEVTVFECIRRADRLVADANTYNDTARRGSYLVVAYQVIYIGDGDATAGMNLTVGLAGANKILYRDFDAAVDLGPHAAQLGLERLRDAHDALVSAASGSHHEGGCGHRRSSVVASWWTASLPLSTWSS